MKLEQLDDETPPEPDDALLAQVRQRSARLRARQRRRTITAVAAAAMLVAGAVGVVWHHAGTTKPRLAVSGSSPRAKVSPGPVSIVGSWKPVRVTGYATPSANVRWLEAPSLRFDSNGRWSGSDGCNDMSGAYQLRPDGSFRAPGPIVQTLVLCRLEFPTIGVVHSTTRVERHRDQLTFLNAKGGVIALYERILNTSESPQWAATGNDIRKNGGSPYLSQPVNITGPGRYTLVFGPLRPTDILRFDQLGHRPGSGIGVSFPNDVTFDGQPDLTGLKTFVRNGATYLRMPFVVATFRTEYDGLRVWVQ